MPALDPANYEAIRVEKRPDGVAVATLSRPERRNAISARMHTEMTLLPYEADWDPDVRVLVITGEGDDFCVGADLTGSPLDTSVGGSMIREGRQVVDRMLDCEIPIISVVRGYALGFGATFALLADVVFAGRSAIFADTHVQIGVGAGDGGQLIWPLLVGVSKAKYYLMTGDKLPAEEAERLGLVTFMHEDEDVLASAIELAERLARGPILAIKSSKSGITAYLKVLNSIIQPAALRAEQLDLMSADRQEARAAFRDKRPPRFEGR